MNKVFALWSLIATLLNANVEAACNTGAGTFTNGQRWMSGNFVHGCHEAGNGWFTSIVACVTPSGEWMRPGSQLVHDQWQYSCVRGASGAVSFRQDPIAPGPIEAPVNTDQQERPEENQAVVVINGDTVHGVIWFSQSQEDEPITVRGRIEGLRPGLHGFHVHQFGDTSNGCLSAGPHFNPFNMVHGGPLDEQRHMGDLGNVLAGPDGVAHIALTDHQLQLFGEHSIVGRALVIHAGQDDLGQGQGKVRAESLKTGNAGARLGCGVIAFAGTPVFLPVDPNDQQPSRNVDSEEFESIASNDVDGGAHGGASPKEDDFN